MKSIYESTRIGDFDGTDAIYPGDGISPIYAKKINESEEKCVGYIIHPLFEPVYHEKEAETDPLIQETINTFFNQMSEFMEQGL